ncbi:MAG: orotidine-5'-phosphate decarboxylase [Thermodesulfobacteriota bacterium]
MNGLKTAKDRIIFPLDFSSLNDAKKYIRHLSPHVGMFKIGLELFIRCGPEIIGFISSLNRTAVFLDLKLHDIPETVYRSVSGIAELNVRFTTVHCGESMKSLEAAVRGSRGKVGILGVTVLTSVSEKDLARSGYADSFCTDIPKLVIKKAEMAKDAGCAGVVCSGNEVKSIKEKFGEGFITITPGIRPIWDETRGDDQVRIVTPEEAIQNGADYLVIGRPIRDASDPPAAAKRVADEIELMLQERQSR